MALTTKINSKCQELFNIEHSQDNKVALLNGVKSIIEISNEVFDKSTDLQTLTKLLTYTSCDIDFINSNLAELSVQKVKEDSGIFNFLKIIRHIILNLKTI